MANNHAYLILAAAIAVAGGIIVYVVWYLFSQVVPTAKITANQLIAGAVDFTVITTGLTMPVSYYWSFGIGGVTETTTVPATVFVYPQGGTYTVTVTCTDVNNNIAVGTTQVTVSSLL